MRPGCTIAAIACNLLRAAGGLASRLLARARAATIRRDLIAVAARIARRGRGHITLHLPAVLAPRKRMAGPARSRLRPARRGGLTSPNPVTHPQRPRATRNPTPEPGEPGQAAGQVSGRTPAPGFIPENFSCSNQARNGLL